MPIYSSLIAPAAMLTVLALLRLALVRPLVGFGLFVGLWLAGGIVSVVFAVRSFRADESTAAWVHGGIALLLLGSFLVAAAGSRAPAIHDVTTDLQDPPEFLQAGSLPANRDRDLAYPHGAPDTPEIQADEYPDVEPIRLRIPPDEALAAARRAAERLGWEITWNNTELGRLEAVDRSSLFRFVDDVVIRVRADGGGSRVDVRSLSRVGRSDLGANAERIRRFGAELRREAGDA